MDRIKNDGVMECWIFGVMGLKIKFHYSINPLIQYSFNPGFLIQSILPVLSWSKGLSCQKIKAE
jgi:hypothetical protein